MFVIRVSDTVNINVFLSPLYVALPFFLIWAISKGKAVGFGDVILFFGVGAFFGSLEGFAVLMISVWVGALYGLYIKYFVTKKRSGYTAIPFVPFVVLAFIVVLFTGIDIFSFFLL
jgi:leader peptidase (prepilin peptidase)/N-methyltransferase